MAKTISSPVRAADSATCAFDSGAEGASRDRTAEMAAGHPLKQEAGAAHASRRTARRDD